MAKALSRARTRHDLFWSGANEFWNVYKFRALESNWKNESHFLDDLEIQG